MNQLSASEIAVQFQMDGHVVEVIPYGSGHINDTFRVRVQHGEHLNSYICQRINHSIFLEPPKVMENIVKVTDHIRKKLIAEGISDISRKVLTVIPARNGNSYYQDDRGNYWRMYLAVSDAQSYDVMRSPQHAYQAAYMFGQFIVQLHDFPLSELHEVLPGFHDGRKRFSTFLNALNSDPLNRAKEAKNEIEFVQRHENAFSVLPELLQEGRIPSRISHNDTKINNVMMDIHTGKGLCVIDLDTVMPGSALYDFGDLARSTLSAADEDETNLNKIEVNLPRFEAILKGFLHATHSLLTPIEKEYLIFSTRIITMIIGIRFLTDFLLGDVYFKTKRPDHNLQRCRSQFQLVKSIIENEEKMLRFLQYPKNQKPF